MSFEEGKIYHGFKLIKQKEIKEINSLARLFLHEKSGARLLHLQNDDENKVFSISFRTPPANSTGLPHILEHSVLCGSKKFPLKDPFVQLAKGSLNTFLNAMTFPDKTMYPIASTNEKDFFNLMDVYLDAVFHPRIYNAPEILMQEGWHYEIDDKDKEITYKGVVYNEMKGAFSSPEGVLFRKNLESLFPDTPYGVESGGDPDEIPNLTQEEFLDFHRRYYHPSNSFIFLYGNGDINQQLQFINENYLSEFTTHHIESKIPCQKPFDGMKEVITEYPVLPKEDVQDKTYMSLNFAVGTATDPELYLAFEILEHLLLETPAAPLKKALLEAELGNDVFGVYDNSILQPVLSIIIKNTNPDKKEKFLAVVKDTLQKLVENGIEKSLIEAAINRREFDLREADYHGYSKGLLYAVKCMDSWLYGAKPTMHLEYEDTLKKIKTALATNYFEKLIEKYILNNTHSSLVILKPEPGMTERKEEEIKKKLAEFKASLTQEKLDELIKQTLKLRKIQETPDTPEELEKLPMLSLKDIKPQAEKINIDVQNVDGAKLITYNDFTNRIAYVNLYFDLSVLPQELVPYAGVLVNVLAKIGTEKYSYTDLANEINIHTGGINFQSEVFLQNNNAEEYFPKLVVKGKALVDKAPKMFELIAEILLATKFTDKNRLKEILQETKSRMEMAMMDQGHVITKNRLLAYFSPRIKFLEQINGLAFYKFLAGLIKDFNGRYEEINASLEKVRKIIFNKNSVIINLTCEKEAQASLTEGLKSLAAHLADEKYERVNYNFTFTPENEGLISPAKVQFVAKAYNFIKLGYTYSGKMLVLRTLLSLDYLWNKVRVQGGAYGSFAGFERNGDMFFCSYRDPNLKETLEVYNNVPNYLKNFNVSDREMTKYIIGTISKLDFPLTPSAKGERATGYFISGISYADIQKEREEVLNTKQDDIKNYAVLLQELMAQDYLCVFGNEAKLKQHQELFKALVQVFE